MFRFGTYRRKDLKMKKIVLAVVALMSVTSVFAADEKENTITDINAYKMNINTYSLSRALRLTSDQYDMVEDINRTFEAEMMNAAVADPSEREAKKSAAIKKDLSYMRYVLNDKQYRNYVQLLNVTMNNRGLNK